MVSRKEKQNKKDVATKEAVDTLANIFVELIDNLEKKDLSHDTSSVKSLKNNNS